MNRSTTDRGFTIYDQFTDRYGKQVTITESSLATESCVWIHSSGGAPHLTVEQARRVRDALGAFIAEQGDDVPPR